MHFFLKFFGIIVVSQLWVFTPDYSYTQNIKPKQAGQNTVNHIGVLAFRGVDAAIFRWQPLANYLTRSIDGHEFVLIPVTLASAYRQIENKSIDFIVTNPGHYVVLAEQFGINVMATRERLTNNREIGLLEYGSAIIVRKESNLKALNGLKRKTIAAVSPEAFGGFQIAWKEFDAQGIDLFTDLESIRFMGFPQDDIITAVLKNEVDAGIVRSGLLELMTEERQFEVDQLRVLNAKSVIDYPYRLSSALYPEWPFAALTSVDKSLREKVLISLLTTQDKEISQRYGLQDIWSVPLSYGEVRKLIVSYKSRLERDSQSGFSLFGLEYLYILVLILVAVLILVIFKFGPTLKRHKERNFDQNEEPELAVARKKFDTLTPREKEILILICEGNQNRTIAQKLSISIKTVEFHRSNLLHKTQAGTTAHLVQLATRLRFGQGITLG